MTRIIIADSAVWARGMARLGAGTWRRGLLARVGSDCPLCHNRAQGGRLCEICAAEALRSMRPTVPRCRRCALRLSALQAHCPDCLRRAPAFERVIAAFDYEPPADVLIAMFKTELRLSLASLLADLLDQAIGRCADWPVHDLLLIPIPAGRASLRRRGFNPPAEIARLLAVWRGWPMARAVLRRRREIPRQSTAGRQARMAAVSGLFYCDRNLAGRHVGLVDDVMTTGSTLDAAARALRRAGAASVICLVAARTPRQG